MPGQPGGLAAGLAEPSPCLYDGHAVGCLFFRPARNHGPAIWARQPATWPRPVPGGPGPRRGNYRGRPRWAAQKPGIPRGGTRLTGQPGQAAPETGIRRRPPGREPEEAGQRLMVSRRGPGRRGLTAGRPRMWGRQDARQRAPGRCLPFQRLARRNGRRTQRERSGQAAEHPPRAKTMPVPRDGKRSRCPWRWACPLPGIVLATPGATRG
jgi:hypothetical protein